MFNDINDIINKYNLSKQKKCIDAIKYVLDDNNIFVYQTAQGLIKYHEEFLDINDRVIKDPLINIRRFYVKHLEQQELLLDKASDKDKDDILRMIEYDTLVLEELSYNFIDNYNTMISKINYVIKNKEYLTNEQKDKLLPKFYEVINNNSYNEENKQVK